MVGFLTETPSAINKTKEYLTNLKINCLIGIPKHWTKVKLSLTVQDKTLAFHLIQQQGFISFQIKILMVVLTFQDLWFLNGIESVGLVEQSSIIWQLKEVQILSKTRIWLLEISHQIMKWAQLKTILRLQSLEIPMY